MVHTHARLVRDDAVVKAAARRRWRAEQWAHGRLTDLAAALSALDVQAEVDWGRTSWEPCLLLHTSSGYEVVWCRPIAVGIADGQPLYRWRFCWDDFRGRPDVYSYPASDVPRAATRLAAFATGTT